MVKKSLMNTLQGLSKHPDVLFAYLFGSAALLNEDEEISDYSDIDIAVYISSDPEYSLSEIQADILADFPYEYDLVSLTSVSLPLQAQAMEGELIFTKSERIQGEFENVVRSKWNAVKHEYKAKQDREFSDLVRRYLQNDSQSSETAST